MITEPIALDKSLNTTDTNPKNVADVLQKGLNDIKNAIGGGGGGGGHTIVDSDGQDMPQEDAMQFADAFVSDDSTNGRTVVENVKEVASADYSSETEDGMYLIPDGEGAVIEPASKDSVEVTASSDTYKTALNKLRNKADFNKITKESYIKFGNNVYIVTALLNNEIYFSSVLSYAGSGGSNIQTIFMPKRGVGNCSFQECVFTSSISRTNKDESSVTDGTKITLYYGNKKAVVDLQTTANRCWMSDGVTSAEDELNYSGKKRTYYGIVITNNMFIVILPPNIVEKGSPTSIESHRIVEIAVGGRSYSSFSFNENGLVVTTTDTNMTMGHAIRFTATITW